MSTYRTSQFYYNRLRYYLQLAKCNYKSAASVGQRFMFQVNSVRAGTISVVRARRQTSHNKIWKISFEGCRIFYFKIHNASKGCQQTVLPHQDDEREISASQSYQVLRGTQASSRQRTSAHGLGYVRYRASVQEETARLTAQLAGLQLPHSKGEYAVCRMPP